VIEKIKIQGPDAVRYDPKVGFHVDLDKIENPEGIYVCTARYKELVRGIEYTVVRTNHTSDKSKQNDRGASAFNPGLCLHIYILIPFSLNNS